MADDIRLSDPTEPMLLPPNLQSISLHFADLAGYMAKTLPRNPERTAMLRKLLEAKDCAVRALLYE